MWLSVWEACVSVSPLLTPAIYLCVYINIYYTRKLIWVKVLVCFNTGKSYLLTIIIIIIKPEPVIPSY